MATDTTKITGAADELSAGLAKGGTAAKTLGAEIANAIKSLDGRVSAIEAGAGTQPPIEPPIEPPTSQYGLITGFTSGTNQSKFKVDGIDVEAENGSKTWSLVKVDDYTLMFEARQGDKWTYDDASCNRTEIQFMPRYSDGQQITLTEKITIMPGADITASWFCINQLHSTAGSPPCPFGFGVDRNQDKLNVVLQSPQGGNNYIWTQPQSVVRGKEYDFKTVVTMRASGNGRVETWLDGQKIVDFTGAVGTNNAQYYWKAGLYRGAVAETSAVRHKNIHIVTG